MAKKAKKKVVKTLPTPSIVKKRMIKGAIRRVFRQSEEMKYVLNQARVELPPKTLKDGSLGKKNQVRYKCAECQQLFSQKNVQVDHIETVVDLHLSEEEMNIDMLAERIWCDVDKLQVLCSTKLKDLPKGEKSCHTVKSGEENFIREQWKELFEKMNISNTLDKSEYANLNREKLEKDWKTEYYIQQEKKKQELLEKEARKKEREEKRKLKNGTKNTGKN